MAISVLNYFLVSLLLDKLLLIQHCNGEVVYVTPTPPPNEDCPYGVPCHTLQHYFSNKSFTERRDNLTLVFISGDHTGFCENTAIKSTALNITGTGGRVAIGCTNIELTNVAAIYFENVILDHWYISSLCPSTATPLKLVINMSSVIAQNHTHVYIEHVRNVRGNFIVFNNCTFKNNSSLSGILYFSQFVGGTFRGGVMNLLSSTLFLGKNTSITFDHNIMRYAAMYLNSSILDVEGAYILFLNNQRAIELYKSALNIMKSNASFVDNASNHSGGGAIYVYNSTMNVSASEMLFLKNSAIGGGAVYTKSSVLVFENNTRVIFKNNTANGIKGVYVPLCTLQSIETDNPEGEGGALRMGFSTLIIRFNTSINFIDNLAFLQGGAAHVYYHSKFIVDSDSNVTFNENSANYTAGALSCALSIFTARKNTIIEFVNSQSNEAGALFADISTVTFENNTNVTFSNNVANFGGALILMSSSILTISSGSALSVINNTAKSSGGAVYAMSSVVITGNEGGVTLNFTNNSAKNEGGSIFFLSSNLLIKDNVSINCIGNSASRGGAIALVSSQIEFLSAYLSNVTFMKNNASQFGGAVYINPDRLQHLQEYINYVKCTYAPCLYSNPYGNNTKHSLHFSQNSAKFGGNDVYGASIELCNGSYTKSVPSVSGSPTRVCKCSEHKQPQCHNPSYIYITEKIYPSETFTISAVIVGGEWGVTTGTVYANFTQPNASNHLKPSSQYTQGINNPHCTELKYNVYGYQSIELMLSVNLNLLASEYYQFCRNSSNYKQGVCKYFSPLYINLNVLPCPPGFSLQGNPPGCNCLTVLSDLGVVCSIKKGKTKFYWTTALWMNVTMNATTYSENCPFDYCKETKKIDYNSDIQCAFNRIGRLCGSCKEIYSLAIGSSHCIYCHSNNNLALLIFFASAGFLLVLFISILNLTVTEGMINGFVFYANIVLRYQSILFPEKMHSRLFFLKIFIAWLNLDFGIETCFIKNLNAFWKIWLQFVFPLYVWSIAGIITLVARYSTRITNLLGNRAVPVLATLILLSYNKLLRTSIDILDFSILTTYESETNITDSATIVWSLDGTLEYFRYPHILLLLAALLTLLCLWLPYTLLLFLIQWLRRISHFWFLKWTTRFHPFYDAYFAPLKPSHQYWFGVLLIVRSVILLTFASNFAIPQDISLILLLASAGILLFYMTMTNVHKRHSVMAFQGLFFLNLCLLSGFMIFAHTKKNSGHALQAFVIGLSTGVVFLQFCCLIFYQIYRMCCSKRRSVLNVHVNKEQAHAILNINTRSRRNNNDTAEIEPLLSPAEQLFDNDRSVVPTY